MKLSAAITFLVAALPAVLAVGTVDYTFTCARVMYSSGGNDDDTLAYFTKLYTDTCINYFNCEHSATPMLGAAGALVNGGCVHCQVGLGPNAFGDCLLAPIPEEP
ncbi:hypothetical protein E4U19_006456 [Claviceps sp. Clav32 group G5]|nr:hypothetical protein E4U40_004510 [Claviceps sp. LM458 group G5]KAG6033507.1 hypothetical protein E4U19_006456 [Claviceps sp. Clav32 group G5]KAG6047868.1 hypothetical protein E4U39_007990 [Claviceps sp. Clav50 group G5]